MKRAITWALFGLCCQAFLARAAPDFARDVRPILERSCYGCHGPEKQKSGYRLDVREIALKGGGSGERAVIPHDAKNSRLARAIRGVEEDLAMPPPDSDAPKLSVAEIDTILRWIEAGPQWPDEFAGKAESGRTHWSLRRLKKPRVPGTDRSAHPIDAFIRAGLAARGMSPAARADRRTLVRRLRYNLTGLPPTPEEAAAFIADGSSTAYEDLVNRLLDSPGYGEHWARHWLDVAHYADTHGNDHDFARPNAWPYRDWLVDAFNTDKPYVRFVREQVAGDVLFADDPRAVSALGFLAAGPWDETLMAGIFEDTVDHRMAQNLDRDDMVATVMSSFQSLTVHCARCHDHKFDPVSQREYYQLQAVFAGIDRVDRVFDDDAAMHVRRQGLRSRLKAIERKDARLLETLNESGMRKIADRLRSGQAKRQEHWKPLELVSVASATGVNTRFARQADGTWLATGDVPQKDTFIITARTMVRDIRALRLETLPDPSLPGQGPGRYDPSGNFHLTEFRAEAHASTGATTGAAPLKFSRASATHGDAGGGVATAIDSQANTHWSVHPHYGKAHEAVFELAEPLDHEGGATIVVRLEHNGHERHQIGRFRLSFCTGEMPAELRAPLPFATAELLRRADARKADLQEMALYQLAREAESSLAKLPTPRRVYAVSNDFEPDRAFKPALKPRPIHILIRGEIDKHGERVGPGALSCLPELPGALAIPEGEDEGDRRAALALWLTDRRNVLTWRSAVNRVWHYHFGRGLCDTPNDFGIMGGSPSHPELLDWLAVWFRDEAGGSLKSLHRLILTSETCRQSTAHNPAAAAVDPLNRLLWRMNRVRLTGEQMRDSLLQLSGRLDPSMGGPSVVLFNHKGDATFMPGGGQPAYVDYAGFDPDAPANRRRSLYRFQFRTLPDPLMKALDVPDGDLAVSVRGQSTTAVQAFALLNNPFVIRMCDHIAARLRKESEAEPETAALVSDAFGLILLREPSDSEAGSFAGYCGKHGLANTVHLLLNSNEFMHIE
jgi:hypothetical protein